MYAPLRLLSAFRSEAHRSSRVSDLKLADLGVAAVFCILGCVIGWVGTQSFDLHIFSFYDIYFESDPPRVLASMTDRWSDLQSRSHVHPVFSLVTFPIVRLFMAFGLTPLAAAQTFCILCAGLSAGLAWLALQGITRDRVFAAVSTGVFLSSAAFIHWGAFVDTYAVASVGLAAMLVAIARLPERPIWLWVLASAGTLAITTTNWMLGLAGALMRLGLRRSLQVAVLALALVTCLAGFQLLAFPHSRLFLDPRAAGEEARFTQVEREAKGFAPWTPLENIRSVLLTTAVAPPPVVTQVLVDETAREHGLTNQHGSRLSLGWPGLAATAAWVVLLAGGLWGAILDQRGRDVAFALAAFLAGQMCLHAVYGEITFLYSLHFALTLTGLVAFGAFTPARRFLLAAGLVFILCGGASNMAQLHNAAHLASGIAAERAQGALASPVVKGAAEQPGEAAEDHASGPAGRI